MLNIYITPGTGETLVSNGKIELGTINFSENGINENSIKLVSAKIVTGNYRRKWRYN